MIVATNRIVDAIVNLSPGFWRWRRMPPTADVAGRKTADRGPDIRVG